MEYESWVAGRMETHGLGYSCNMLRSGTATTAEQVDPSLGGKFTHESGHLGSRLILTAEGIGQTRVRITADVAVS